MNNLLRVAILGIAAASFVVSPQPQLAAEAECGPNSGNMCSEDQACVNILFYTHCTTKYQYYD